MKMLKTNKHIIQRQTFEMHGYSKRPGFEWEQRVAEHHRNIIMPGIEACFDAVPETDEHLVIDSIDIDLGVFTHESFVQEQAEELRLVQQNAPPAQQWPSCGIPANVRSATASAFPALPSQNFRA